MAKKYWITYIFFAKAEYFHSLGLLDYWQCQSHGIATHLYRIEHSYRTTKLVYLNNGICHGRQQIQYFPNKGFEIKAMAGPRFTSLSLAQSSSVSSILHQFKLAPAWSGNSHLLVYHEALCMCCSPLLCCPCIFKPTGVLNQNFWCNNSSMRSASSQPGHVKRAEWKSTI